MPQITTDNSIKSLPHTGLTKEEAQKRLKSYGTNEIRENKKISEFWEFFIKFKNPLVLILLCAAVVSAFVGDWTSSVIIIAIVVLSVILDFTNTFKSKKAAETLTAKVSVTAHAIRDGKLTELPLKNIVPGDVVILEAGDLIPADGKIISAKDFFINESALTGESFPVKKNSGEMVYLGTDLVTGAGAMLVETTGRSTKFGFIVKSLAKAPEPTEFDHNLKDFSYLIMRITFILVLCIFFINAALKHNILESFLFSAALAVGLTPELLPLIIALNLSKGSINMAKHGVIVKRLEAIQNFGSIDVLCADKTGTLTEDKITLVKYVDALGQISETVFRYAYISSMFRSGFHNILDNAIKNYKTVPITNCKKLDEIPFDYIRKRDTLIVEEDGHTQLLTKGAPEELIKACKYYHSEQNIISPEIQTRIFQEYESLSSQGFRVLAVARKNIERKESYAHTEEFDLVLLGFVAFFDPPKKSVAETLKTLENYGIEIKIITGDNELVTRKIAEEINLPIKGMLKGADILNMSDDVLRNKTKTTTIFSRVSPDQKKRIIEQIKMNGHTVGYLGDGINDAPPLKAADVGISVNNAVDVAKESADLILLNKNLNDLVNGVLEGRRTFVNTSKYLLTNISSNFGNMFSMAGASLFFPFLPMLPTQILFNNLLFDASQFAIPLDNVDTFELMKPKKFSIKNMKKIMLIFGPISSLFDFLTFAILWFGFHANQQEFQTGWFLESLATQGLVIFIIRAKKLPFIGSRPSIFLVISAASAVLLGWAVALTKIGSIFNFVPVSPLVIYSLLAVTIAYFTVMELAKKVVYKNYT